MVWFALRLEFSLPVLFSYVSLLGVTYLWSVCGGGAGQPASPTHLMLQLSFGACFAVLEPIVHIGLRDLTILAKLDGNVFDPCFVGRVAIPLLEYALEGL
jgi:hypothetical protein